MMESGKKKLLVTASTFPRWEGDTEPRFVLDYAKAMQTYYDVTVAAPMAVGAKRKELLEGVKIVRYHYFPIHKWETLCYPGAIMPRIREKKQRIVLVPCLFFSLYVTLRKLCKEIDIVHAHWIIPQGIVQFLIKSKPYFITGHGGDISSFNKGILRKWKDQSLFNAQGVAVVSEFKRKELNQYFPRIKVKELSMGVDTVKFNPDNRKNDFFNTSGKKVILFVGRLVEIKGVQYLIEAMKRIDAKLVIVGNGPNINNLEHQSREIAEKVSFLGTKTHYELPEIYASADIVAVPSITDDRGEQEGLPTTILEGMASGVPVIATETGGIINVIQDKENGLLVHEKNAVELADAITLLLKNTALYERIRKNALETSKKYDYAVIAKRYHEWFQSVLGGKNQNAENS